MMRKGKFREIWIQDGVNHKYNLTDTLILLNDVTATADEITAAADVSAQAAMEWGSGFGDGTNTIYKSAVMPQGDFILTKIYIDIVGAKSVATDLDIIGTHASNYAHIGQITAAINGTIVAGQMTCLEVPAGGADDIDVYSAVEGTGVYDYGIGVLQETAHITAGAAWTLMETKTFVASPDVDSYLYLVSGEAVAGTYTAGRFLIELWGII